MSEEVQNHPDITLWRQRIQDWYPGLYEQTYFLPPVHMNRTQYREVTLRSGQTAHVYDPPVYPRPKGAVSLSDSDVRDDQCQQLVLKSLRQLSEEDAQVMFVLSQLNFVNYLNEPCFQELTRELPKPVDLKSSNQHRGEFDILIIHRHYGILVAEIKAVGDKMLPVCETKRHGLVKDRVEKGVKQLQKEETVLKHLMSDLPSPHPRVLKTLMLPHISSEQLRGVLDSEPQLRKVK